MAGRGWAQLLLLRANPYPEAVPALRQMADQISIKGGPVLHSDHKINTVRSSAWLAVCALLKQIETDPNVPGIEELWLAANDAMKTWEREAE
jgi:hypothetical protein